ncbi:MAG: Chaperone protein HscA [Chlamydiales bacterium]|nr:Chaperone protein HscA [Chlamydiales bacterium]MCH9635293.1 Chaperone protein HscA [Chlamydiales bacterium]MCH9704089.1 Hsp70 family protein [Chlamydiota bacterium]
MIVGIDLGTTNSCLAYQNEGEDLIHQFPIEQRVDQDEMAELFTLPSFYLFLPDEQPTVGQFAKVRGEELPDRVITSAKSWLCHSGVDRRQPFLPLDFDQKVSPVTVMAAYLSHLKTCWEKKMPPLVEQSVFITVPASFDPDARALVIEAAKEAGYPTITLLEEPLAAFYSWLSKMGASWRDHLKVNERVLVVDIGGGTSDFTLIRVEEEGGNLQLKREAVGQHLLLGGDNLDHALAHFVQQKAGKPLPMAALVHSCRQAKEELLSGMKETTVTVLGQGSSLIGNTTKISLTQEEVQRLLVDGFFPQVDLDCEVESSRRVALGKLGLPFVRDPRITAQLALFCRQNELPTAILFNGGTLKAAPFQERVRQVLSSWGGPVRILPDPDYDFAVGLGAVSFGSGKGVRVKAPSPRSFWVGIEGAQPAIPGVPPQLSAACLIPYGLEEGSETVLDEEFTLVLGEPTLFRFFSSDRGSLGQRLDSVASLEELAPIEREMEDEAAVAIVKLKGRLTELGMLELWCEADDGRRWMLEFNARQDETELAASS